MIDVRAEIKFVRNFLTENEALYQHLLNNMEWNESIKSRKTACFGEPYNYSETSQSLTPMPDILAKIAIDLEPIIGFKPNNCLLNYYENGNSRLGWHGDTISFLEPNTGIAIVSLGDPRIFQIRRNEVHTEMYNYVLNPGSLLCMPASIQSDWKHSIPKVVSADSRISLTFRRMVPMNE